MIRSMTGYGDAACEVDGVSYVVEVKTVNNRYLKTNIRLHEALAFLSDDIEKLLRKNLHRGTVNYIIRVGNNSDNLLFGINQAALEGYTQKLKQAAESAGIEYQVSLTDLLTLPGVIRPAVPDEEKAEKMRSAVVAVTQQALDNLIKMREQEGLAVAQDLKSHCETIKTVLAKICQRSPVVVVEYHDKLKDRIQKLLEGAQLQIDEEILAREVAVFAERCDISEELARLDSHLNQFLEGCQRQDHVGRRLDFICQEMLREANTIASKSSDTEIMCGIVDVKCQIDRIKEQVQNIE